MPIEIDRVRLFDELQSKFDYLSKNKREKERILFGINNTAVYKSGSVVEGQTLLRILEEEEWKRELGIYSSSGIVTKAINPHKGEVTSVVYFSELGDQAYELRYWALEWSDRVSEFAPGPEQDPRINVLPQVLSDFHCIEPYVYVYVELKPLLSQDWIPCCVCGIQRASPLDCSWNSEIVFCSEACKSMATAQRAHEEKTSVGGDDEDINSTSQQSVTGLKDRLEAVKLK